MSNRESSGGLGCLGTIVVITMVWALVFGFTVHGHHYGINCTCDRGVVIE